MKSGIKYSSSRQQGNACIVTLGCPKNTVEGEKLAGLLRSRGWELSTRVGAGSSVIVHTCSFIKDARDESEKTIASLAALKRKGFLKALYVTGCLAQEERGALLKRFKDADGALGTGELHKLPDMLLGKGVNPHFTPGGLLETGKERLLSSSGPSAYLRIAEGCNHTCSFCVIPKLRGRYKSRQIGSIIREAETLAERGIKELCLIAQDTTYYGKDIYGSLSLHKLIKRLAAVQGIRWIRILYAYPDTVTAELLEAIRNEPKVCKYIDIPLQHTSPNVLKRMRRNPGALAAVESIRKAVPGIAVRTTFITGFPGETEKDFKGLLEAVKSGIFEHVGVFEYSPHPDTPAAKLPGRPSPKSAARRRNALMLAQQKNVLSVNRGLKGRTLEVLCEGRLRTGEYFGRSRFQAPEIDSLIYFTGKAAAGKLIKVRITGYKGYDLYGKIQI